MKNSLAIKESGRGRKSSFPSLQKRIILLTFLKNYPSFAFLASIFKSKPNPMEALIHRTSATIRPALVAHFVVPISKRQQLQLGITSAIPEVALIIDCCVQKCYRPTGSFGESKANWSGKHWMYCWKREYAHLPNGKIVSFRFGGICFSCFSWFSS